MPSLEEIYSYAYSLIPECTCLNRSYVAVIADSKKILSVGYAHAPKSFMNCKTSNICQREYYQELYSRKAEFFEHCQVIHAEMHVLINIHTAINKGAQIYLLSVDTNTKQIYKDATPCEICRKVLIESGFEKINIFITPDNVKSISLYQKKQAL